MKPDTYGAIAFLLLFFVLPLIAGAFEARFIPAMLLAVLVLIGAGWCTYKAGKHHEKD